jgi:ribosomal protein S18 acetylase RimI-like enzyme
MPVTVRRITAHDSLQLREIRLAALADAPDAFAGTLAEESKRPYSSWSDRARTNASSVTSATFFAVDDREVVGLVGAFRPEATTNSVQLVSLWVAPAARGRDVGRALVLAVVAWANEIEVDAVTLWVTCGNTRAEALYASVGFATDNIIKPLPSDPCKDEQAMTLILESSTAVR